MRQKELELIVGKWVLNLYKSPNHHKKLAEGEKLEKSTQRGTVPCNSCVPSRILFSFIFLPFTILILLFVFSATVSACLRLCANKQKQWLKKWTIWLKMRTVERQMRTEHNEQEHNYCKEQVCACLFFNFVSVITCVWTYSVLIASFSFERCISC